MKNNQNIFPQPLPAKVTVFDMYNKSNTRFFTDKGNLTTGHWFMFRKFAPDSLIKRGDKLYSEKGSPECPKEDCISSTFSDNGMIPTVFKFCEINRDDEKYCAVFLSETGYTVLNGKWVKYFMQCGATAFYVKSISPSERPVIIKKDGEIMGIIMPIKTGDFNFEREKNVVDVIEHFHKIAHGIPTETYSEPHVTTESVTAKIVTYLSGRGNTHIKDIAKAIKESEPVVEKALSEIGLKNITPTTYIQKTSNFYRLVLSDDAEPEAIPEKKGNPEIDIAGLQVMPNVKFKTDNERQRNKMWQKPFQIIPRIEYQRLLSILDDNLSDFFNDNGKLVTIGITHKDEYVLISVKEQFWGEYGL